MHCVCYINHNIVIIYHPLYFSVSNKNVNDVPSSYSKIVNYKQDVYNFKQYMSIVNSNVSSIR